MFFQNLMKAFYILAYIRFYILFNYIQLVLKVQYSITPTVLL